MFLTHYLTTNKNGVHVFTFKIKRRLADKSRDRKTLDGWRWDLSDLQAPVYFEL